ncbi:hypothetical protein HALLA_06395 [Halostagnicola larsenii XH-48]|uniref:Uncharacterized protein n=1 Tax=Halostagnicola larsenii XH-48 TaxID=797299 RepID=W0JMJ0_9EURY|nr:hypothetical protein [Halostagnicola larsenii]AHF98526.1 hypothetical protein HALLA_06395 [Halostagnicola larsenii XH-48]
MADSFWYPSVEDVLAIHDDVVSESTEEDVENSTQLDEAMEDIRQELVRQVAAADRDENRDVYDALENE